MSPCTRKVVRQVIAQHGRDRHPAPTCGRLQLDATLAAVPAVADVDHAGGNVDILSSQSNKLPMPKAAVQGRW